MTENRRADWTFFDGGGAVRFLPGDWLAVDLSEYEGDFRAVDVHVSAPDVVGAMFRVAVNGREVEPMAFDIHAPFLHAVRASDCESPRIVHLLRTDDSPVPVFVLLVEPRPHNWKIAPHT